MRVKRDRISDKVLKEIFPKKLSRFQSSDEVYTQLKTMILSGKLKKKERLTQEEIVQRFNLNRVAGNVAFSRLKKENLIITKRGVSSFIAWPLWSQYLKQSQKTPGRKLLVLALIERRKQWWNWQQRARALGLRDRIGRRNGSGSEGACDLFVVVYRMFQKAHGKIKKISSEEIIERYEHNESLMERLERVHGKFLVIEFPAFRLPDSHMWCSMWLML